MGVVLLYLILISTLGWFFGALGNLWSLGLFWVGGGIGWLIDEYLLPKLLLSRFYAWGVIWLASVFVFTSSESILGRGLISVLLGLELINRSDKTYMSDRTNRTYMTEKQGRWFRVVLAGWWLGLNYLLISKLMVRAGF